MRIGAGGICQEPDLVKNLHYNRAALSPLTHTPSLNPPKHVTASKIRVVLFLRRCCSLFRRVVKTLKLSERLKVFVFLVTQNLVLPVRFQISLTKSVDSLLVCVNQLAICIQTNRRAARLPTPFAVNHFLRTTSIE